MPLKGRVISAPEGPYETEDNATFWSSAVRNLKTQSEHKKGVNIFCWKLYICFFEYYLFFFFYIDWYILQVLPPHCHHRPVL